MRRGLVFMGLLAAITVAPPARADVFVLSNFAEVSARGSSSTGKCINQGGLPTDPVTRFFDDEEHVDTQGVQLKPGLYRAFMGRSTGWRILKTKNTSDPSQFYLGWVEVQVIRQGPFGAENVETVFVRGYDSSGAYQWPGFPDDRDLGSFVVPANSIDVYFVRAIAHAAACSEARVTRLSVELVGPS